MVRGVCGDTSATSTGSAFKYPPYMSAKTPFFLERLERKGLGVLYASKTCARAVFDVCR